MGSVFWEVLDVCFHATVQEEISSDYPLTMIYNEIRDSRFAWLSTVTSVVVSHFYKIEIGPTGMWMSPRLLYLPEN